MKDVIIRASNLIKRFDSITPVNNVSIEIKKGYFYSIMGKSGSGKTTLLSLLGLLDSPTSGQLFINDINVSDMKANEKAFTRMKELGFVFQDFHLNPILNACENVMIPMYINPKYKNVDIKDRAKELLTLFGLENRINHYPSQLSGGEKQRVALARALANEPKCILADEPTGNLDDKSELIVLDHLKMLTKNGTSVVVVSHSSILLDYADYTFYMNEGSLRGGIDEK